MHRRVSERVSESNVMKSLMADDVVYVLMVAGLAMTMSIPWEQITFRAEAGF